MLPGEIQAKHIIGQSGLGSVSQSVNPYVGCAHACVYCYAAFMKRFTNHREPWGSFVDCKVNAADLFPADYRRLKPGAHLFFGSVTDVYQPAEEKMLTMRRILAFLAEETAKTNDLPKSLLEILPAEESTPTTFSILTKSDLVLRDLDFIRRIPNLSVGFSIAMPNERARRIFEPGAATLARRLNALRECHQAGVSTFVFINPVLPFLTPFEEILSQIAPNADSVFGESLNPDYGNLPQIADAVRRYRPALLNPFLRAVYDLDYWQKVRDDFCSTADREGIPCDGFHIHRPKTKR